MRACVCACARARVFTTDIVTQAVQMICFVSLAAVGAAGRANLAKGILAGSYLAVMVLEFVASVGYAVNGQVRDSAWDLLTMVPAGALALGLVAAERRILYVFVACAAALTIVSVRNLSLTCSSAF